MVFISCYLYFITGLLCIQESVYAYVGDTYDPQHDGDSNVKSNTNLYNNVFAKYRRLHAVKRNIHENSNLKQSSMSLRGTESQRVNRGNRDISDTNNYDTDSDLYKDFIKIYAVEDIEPLEDVDSDTNDGFTDSLGDEFYGDAQRRNDNYNTNTNTNMNTNTIMRRYQPGRRRSNYNANQNTNLNEAIHRRLRDPGNRFYDSLYNNLQGGTRRLQRALSKSRRSNMYRRSALANGDNKNNVFKRRRKADDDDAGAASPDDSFDLDELMNGPLRELFTCSQSDQDAELDENAAEAEAGEQNNRRFNRNPSGRYRKAYSLSRRNRRNYQLGYPLSRRQLAENEEADDNLPLKAEDEENNAVEQNSRKSTKKRARRKQRRSNTRTKNVNTNQNFNSNIVGWREAEQNKYNAMNPYSAGDY